jgi:uncharacterized membrane protein
MEISNSGEKWDSKLFRILNSAMSFGVAYIILTAGSFLVRGLVAKMYNIKCTVYFYGIHFNADPKVWDRKNSVIVHSSGLMFIFFISLLSWGLLKKSSRLDSPLRLIFLWTFVIGICLFCSQFLSGALGVSDHNSPFGVDFAFALAWLNITPIIAFMLASAMAAIMGISTLFFVRQYLVLAFSYKKVYKLKARRKYFFETAMIPCLIGALFTTTLIFPERFIFIHFVQLAYLLTAMVICWYILFYVDIDYDSVSRHTSLEKVNFLLIILVVLATVFTQTLLQKGIKF